MHRRALAGKVKKLRWDYPDTTLNGNNMGAMGKLFRHRVNRIKARESPAGAGGSELKKSFAF
jgi:hypothetical protein